MNKELIKKYKAEFDHWLNDGELLILSLVEKKWIQLNVNCWSLSEDRIIIINDAYVEFRKALAEGKIVEFKHPQVGYDEWEIVTPEHLFQSVVPGREYRIKPEYPQFKIGDWFVFKDNTKHKITEINKFSYTFDNNFSCGFETDTVLSMKHWKPKQDEWCWFWDKLDLKPFLSKFIENTKDGSFVSEGITFTSGRVISIYCEPFIGELPTKLKEK